MSSIRRMCCNDLLDMTPITINQRATTGQDSYRSLLCYGMVYPDYALVVLDMNKLFIVTARIDGDGTERCCDITEMDYRGAEFAELSDMFIQKIVDKADKICAQSMMAMPSHYGKQLQVMFPYKAST
ncbi:hypothetical protein C5167_014020 [Papaver somniferum]|uniref:Uncharacterized protein n=1 Tax=Papaver somniferum TaxID=3469 RepID=A0A4Y7J2Y0_PAPSO|nr:hypothetical protein C5167_014020 [Papaver somniferum]